MKKILISLGCAIAIIVMVVVFKNAYSCRLPIGNRGIADLTKTENLDVLFVGSSSFRSNLDIDVLDEKFEGRDYILSYGGNQYVANVIQYDEIVGRMENPPKVWVFEMDPLLLTEEVKLSESRVIWDLSFDGKKRLWNKMKESENNTDFKVWYEYFVTSGIDDLVTFPVTEPFYSKRYKKGAKTGESVSPGKEQLDAAEFDISDLKVVKAQERAVIELIEKCERDNREFVFLETPHYVKLAEDETYLKYKEYFINLLKSHGARVITAEDTGFDNSDPDYFEDMGHMTNLGREIYTKQLMESFD